MMLLQKVIFLILLSLFCTSYGNYPELQLSEELYNFDIDNETNNIFIGGKNVLLKASPTLKELRKLLTGPEMDYINCTEELETCKQRLADNRNKILLIDNANRKLITCGSLKHGVCQVRNLQTLLEEMSKNKEYQYVVSNSRLPSVAVIAPNWDGKPALYIATSWDEKYGRPHLGVLIRKRPAVSTRNMEEPSVFAVSEVNPAVGTSYLEFDDFSYLVKYIYGFSSGGFTYFVSVQETSESYKSKENPRMFNTFIIRICQRDRKYLSYLELPLECQGSNGTKFNIATSAYLTKPGGSISKSFGREVVDVLVVTFVKTIGRWSDTAQNSGVCFYPVNEINKKLANDQKKCVDGTYKGEDYELKWTAGVQGKKCADTVGSSLQIPPNFCPPPTFKYIKYRSIKLSATNNAIVEYDQRILTAVAAMPYYNHTVLFIGTSQGQLLKVSAGDSRKKVKPYSVLNISSDEVQQLKLTSDQKYLVALSKHKVTKIPVEECSSLKSCADCVGPGDPFCGWCTLYKSCGEKHDCFKANVHPLQFVTSVSKCVQIVSVSPDKVPHGAIVHLIISIANLPPVDGQNSYKCFINGKERPSHLLPGGKLNCTTPPSDQLPTITSETGMGGHLPETCGARRVWAQCLHTPLWQK